MRPTLKYLIISAVPAVAVGSCGMAMVVTDYDVTGLLFVVLAILFGIISFILLFAGLVIITKPAGPALLLAAILLPGSFLATGAIAKHFAVGAQQEEPIRPIVAPIANKVIFNKNATHDDVQKFWTEVLSDRVGVSGERTRPVQGISSNPRENGREVVTFSFFANATEAEKADVRLRIRAFPPVFEFLENVDTTPVVDISPDLATPAKTKEMRVIR